MCLEIAAAGPAKLTSSAPFKMSHDNGVPASPLSPVDMFDSSRAASRCVGVPGTDPKVRYG